MEPPVRRPMRPWVARLRGLLDDLPLRPTIAATLLIGLTVPVGIAMWRDLSEWRDSLLRHLAEDHARTVEVLAIAMATPLWEVRPDTGRPLVSAFMQDPRVVSIRVTAPQIPVFVADVAPARRHGQIIAREADIRRDGEVIGRLRVEMTTALVDVEVARRARQALLAGFLQLTFGLVLLFPLLRHKVLSPLSRLVQQSRALARGELDQPYHWRRHDELGELGQSFEEMRRALGRLIRDLEARNADLRERETALTQQTRLSRALLDNMTDGISLVDADLRLLAWNDQFARILELPAETIQPGMPITQLHLFHVERRRYTPELTATFLERMREGFTHDKPWQTQLETAAGRCLAIRRQPLAEGGFVTTYTDVTEPVAARRKADEALALLEAVMDAVPAILHVKDRDLRYRMVNRYFLDLWSLHRDDVIGRTVNEVFRREWMIDFVDRGPDVLASGQPLPFYEITMALPDGERRDFFGTKVPLTDENGAVTHVVTVEIDISARKHAERALRESEQLYRLLVDLAPFGIMLHDRHRIRFLNTAGCRILGVDEPTPVLGMHYVDFVEDAERKAALARVNRLFDEGDALKPLERRLVTIDGVPVDASVSAMPVRRNDQMLALVVFQDITERKRTERALRESEEFYRQMIELSPYGILLHDERCITYLNPAGQKLLAVEHADEVVGRPYGDIVHPDERAVAEARLARVRDLGEPAALAERRLLRRDGKAIDVAIVGVPLMRAGRTLVFIMFGDITERKRLEQARQRWLQFFQDAIESIPNGFAIFDEYRQLVICNSAFAELYENTCTDLTGQPALDLLQRFGALAASVDGIPVAQIADHLDALLQDVWSQPGLPVQVELKDGRWFLLAHHRTRDGGLVIVRTDVTDLKRMQEALSNSEEMYRLLVDLSPYGIILHDGHAVVFVNAAGCRIFGAKNAAQVSGRHYASFLDEADREWTRQRLDGVLHRGEGVVEMEHRLTTLDQRGISVACSAVPFTREGERLVLMFLIDISSRKRAELEIARHREALHQAEKMSALGSLLAGVAHELNNPLSVVVGRSIMLEETAHDPATISSVAKIRAAAERCARIVRTFLAMARQQAPQRLPVALNEPIEAALDLLGYSLKHADIEVVVELSPELPPTLADPDQLMQVFNNLIVNAKQAMAESPSPRVLRITARHDAAAKVIRIGFADSGPGIPREIRARVFDPYFTTKPPGGGTGIGLAVCRGIIEAHGGSIELQPAEGGGACFVVTLPATDEAMPKTATPRAVTPPETGEAEPMTPAEPSPLAGLTALVIDDEPDVVAMLCDILEADGMAVGVAENGREALALLGEPWDVVLSDLAMPELDGQGLYRVMQQQAPHLLAHLAFITGDTLGRAARQFLTQAKRPVMEKPFTPDDVRRLVRELIADACATVPDGGANGDGAKRERPGDGDASA